MSSDDLTWFKSSYSSGEGGECLEVAYSWRRSSYSDGEGGQCLEVAYGWRKSSHSGGEGGECLEAALTPTAVHIRDSKHHPHRGPQLTLSPAAWVAFLSSSAADE